MNVAPIDGATYFGAKPAKPKSELDMEQFIRLLTVQLANQNPMEPMNDRDFFAQMAQLGQVQGLEKVNENLDIQKAQSMIGKEVTAVRNMTDENANGKAALVTGTVAQFAVRNGEYWIGIREANGGIAEVKLENLQSMKESQPGTSNDLVSAARLIGTEVSWTTTNESGSNSGVGVVQSIGTANGQIRANVKTPDGKVVQVNLNDFNRIGLPDA